MTVETVEVCVAFGTASLAVAEVTELMARGHLDFAAVDLFAKVRAAHSLLRVLFAHGRDEDVLMLVPTVVELAVRTACAIEKEESRPGN
jgi:hypothetical protein